MALYNQLKISISRNYTLYRHKKQNIFWQNLTGAKPHRQNLTGVDKTNKRTLFAALMALRELYPNEFKWNEEYVINSNFTLLPIEIIRNPETNLNRHIGKRYYVHAVMIGDYFSGDGFDLYELFLSHEGLEDVDPDVDGWEYFFALSLAVTPEQVDWEDTVYGTEYIYYFEYLGYDDEAGKHLGKYVSHSPWSRQR